MIVDRMNSFQEKQAQLPDLLKDFDSAELKKLDAELNGILEEIFFHQPENAAEFRALIAFFLDLLLISDDGGNRRAISRIVELTEYAITLGCQKPL